MCAGGAATNMDRKRKCPSKACYCAALTVWLFVAFLVFLVSCWVYLGPLLRVLRYRFTTCEVTNTFYTTRFVCHCPGSGCKSSYPCVLIHVSFNVSEETWTVALYQDEDQQESVVGVDQDTQEWCSLRVCQRDSMDNHRKVETFQERYGRRGDTLQCGYDPWNVRDGAVLAITPVTMVVFHALFWPFLAIAVGVTLCVLFCHRCRQEDAKKSDGGAETAVQLTKVEDGLNANQAPDPGSTEARRSIFKSLKLTKSLDSGKRTKVKGLSKSKSVCR